MPSQLKSLIRGGGFYCPLFCHSRRQQCRNKMPDDCAIERPACWAAADAASMAASHWRDWRVVARISAASRRCELVCGLKPFDEIAPFAAVLMTRKSGRDVEARGIACRLGTWVGDEARRVELLRYYHRSMGREAQSRGCNLEQSDGIQANGRREGASRGRAAIDNEGSRSRHTAGRPSRLALVKARVAHPFEARRDTSNRDVSGELPILLRHKSVNLALPLHSKPEGRRLAWTK